MTMHQKLLNVLIALMLLLTPTIMFGQSPPDLGTASKFVIFTAVGDFNNVGASTVTGDIGTHVGALTGFPIPGTLVGQSHVADPAATQAATDVATAYGYLSTVTCGIVLGTTIGNGQTLTPDVYCLGGAADANGIDGGLILDGEGNPDALFIFKIDGALSTSTYSKVRLINGASECNVYWQINGQFTLGEYSEFRGTVLTSGAINLLTASKLYGRALSTSGAVNISAVVATATTCNAKPPVPIITGPSSSCVTKAGNVYKTLSSMTNYLWTISAGGTITSGGTSTSNTVTVTWNTDAAQTVSVNYTDANNNTAATPTVYDVTVNPFPTAVITPDGVTTFCEGNSVILQSSLGDSYLWSTGEKTKDITATTTGNYSVTVSNEAGCSATSAVTKVTVNATTPATITPDGDVTICEGNSVVLTSSPGSSYLWSTGETTKTISVSTAGNYSVTTTNESGCPASSLVTKVEINPLPTAIITSDVPTTICEGKSVILTASINSSYLWSNGETTQNITVSTAGDYSVVVSNDCGKTNTSAVTKIKVNPFPEATITPNGTTTICQDNSVKLTASQGSSYLWSNNETTKSITVTDAGNYSVTVTNGNGCSAISIPTTVTVFPLSIATITAGGATTFCEGNEVILTSSPGYVKWSTGETTQSIIVKTAGDYYVTVTGGNGCSVTSSATTITVNSIPVATITAGGTTSICQGNTVTLTSSSGNSYLWSNGETSQSITVSDAGNYSVTVSNEVGCTTTSANTTITVTSLPVATITPSGATSFCEGSAVILSTDAADTYLWSNGATTQSITVTQSGTYTVNTFNTNKCNAVSTSQTVTVYPLPVVATLDKLPVMVSINNPSILLSGLPAGGIYSGAGVSGSLFNPAMAGLGNAQITYTYTNENNCSKSVSGNVMVFDTIGHVCIDTVHVTLYDSVKICVETNYVTVYDTVHISVTDTLFINVPVNGVGGPFDYNTILVYPNPTSSHVYINTGNFSSMNGYNLNITNSLGQTIFKNNINQQLFNIDLSTFGTKGIYFIHIINPSSKVITTRKIILQ